MSDIARVLKYIAVNRHGITTFGQVSCGSPAEFVEKRFDQRYRELTVKENGVEVGGIRKHEDTGRRIWWAER